MRITIETYGTGETDLANQLEKVAADIRSGWKQGPIEDENGNNSGSFSITRDDPDK